MNAMWQEKMEVPEYKSLDGNLKTDVLIIGAGIAGILCAYQLKKAGVDCVLIEKGRICSGVTQNTTAKITAQHRLIYSKIAKEKGMDNAALYLKGNLSAIKEFKALSQNINCDYKEIDTFVYSLNNIEKLKNEKDILEQIGCNVEFVESPCMPFSTVGALMFHNQGQFNPLKFLFEISRDIEIYENTKVKEFMVRSVKTDRGIITADKIVITTHFPMLNKHGMYFLKMYQSRSYVAAVENIEFPDGAYVDENENGMSFRKYGELLLIGGGSHRTGEKGGGYCKVKEFIDTHFKSSNIRYQFATQDCMTLDGLPYIGKYSNNTPNLFVATGFNKWGMTQSMLASHIICEQIKGNTTPYDALFSPSRSILSPQLFINGGKAIINLITPTSPRCPHMGCALKYNQEENSWDCPCHGSRFNENFKVINNPATDDIKKGKRNEKRN